MSPRIAVWAASASLCLVSAMLGLAVPASSAKRTEQVTRPCSRGLVALTIDDGPSTTVTAKVLDLLVARKVSATFFVLGERVAAAPALARRAHRSGFVIGNHTYRHEWLTALSDHSIRATLDRTARELRRAGARPSRLMRPPYGAIDARVRSVTAARGLTAVLWDIDPRDWQSGTSAEIAARVLGALRQGGSNIVLLHDGVRRSPLTLGALPAIIRGARARGYCFAALGPSGRPVPPVPHVRITDDVVTEPRPGGLAALRFTLHLDQPTSRRVSVRVRTTDVTTTIGEDYRRIDRRVVFPIGSRTRHVSVRVSGDRMDERRERLRLALSAPRGVTVLGRYGVGTIRDDDPAPRIRLSDVAVTEPASGSVVANVRVQMDRPRSRRVELVLATVPGEADESDYVPFEITVSVASGQVGINVPVEVLADALEEPAETFQVQVLAVRWANVADGTATVTIAPAE